MKTLLRNSHDAGFPLLTSPTPSTTSSMLRLKKANDGAHCECPTHGIHRRCGCIKTQAHTVPLFIKVAYDSLKLRSNTPEG